MPTSKADTLIEEIQSLKDLKIVQSYQKPARLFWINFMIGVARGIGALAGVSIFMTVFVYILSQFQWVPVMGDIITEILLYIEGVKPHK